MRVIAAAAVGALVCMAVLPTPAVAAERPNFVFILADDLGYGDLACYGRGDIQTPHLDQLARQGVRFTNHYANGAECTPTRAALLTGRYPQWIGGLECAIGTGNVGRYDDAIRLAETHELGLPPDQPTIAQMLKEVGYATAITGKWHLGYDAKFAPHHHGFDKTFYCVGGGMDYFHYLDNLGYYNLFQDGNPIRREGYFTDLAADEAIRFIEQHRQTAEAPPFFLYLPFTSPHSPFQGPGDHRPDPLPFDSPLWRQGSAPPQTYVAMIEAMDQAIGRLLAVLDQLGIGDNTVVMFASDNGGTASARNTPLSDIKGSTYEGGIRVPGIIRWPGVIDAGTVSDQVCITFDFTRSIAELAGVEADPAKPFEGIDIVQHVAQRRPDYDRTLFWRKPRGNTIYRGARQGRYKYVSVQKGEQQEDFLFDLATDIQEKHDLKSQHPQLHTQLKGLFDQWEAETHRDRRGRPDWVAAPPAK